MSTKTYVLQASVILYTKQVAAVPQAPSVIGGQQQMGLLGGVGPKLPWASPLHLEDARKVSWNLAFVGRLKQM